jgi:hypothetical protein
MGVPTTAAVVADTVVVVAVAGLGAATVSVALPLDGA